MEDEDALWTAGYGEGPGNVLRRTGVALVWVVDVRVEVNIVALALVDVVLLADEVLNV